METNITLISTDRQLFGVTIRQQTKTGFLNMSDLQSSYNEIAKTELLSTRRIDNILMKKEHYERLFYVLKEQGFITATLEAFIQTIENHGIMHTLKKLKVYKVTGARHTKTAWANPYLWMLVALELHPKLYAKTVIWLADKLIINRIEAGNFYKGLTNSVSKFKNVDYIKLAKGLNYIVFGEHKKGIRNEASAKELKELEILEMKLSYAIDRNYIKSFNELINEMRFLFNEKKQNIDLKAIK